MHCLWSGGDARRCGALRIVLDLQSASSSTGWPALPAALGQLDGFVRAGGARGGYGKIKVWFASRGNRRLNAREIFVKKSGPESEPPHSPDARQCRDLRQRRG